MKSGHRSVAVIGAGAAGLAAAFTLVSAGHDVVLYDARAEPGGRLRTAELEGVRMDVAVQLLGSYYDRTLRLAREAGADNRLARAPGLDALWRNGRAHPVAYGSVTGMAASRALPTGLKLRLGTRYVGYLSRHARALDVNDPRVPAAAGLDVESIAAWGHRELGEDFVELLVYPQLAAYYGTVPEETSAGFYHSLARAGMSVGLYAVRGGMVELARALVRAIEARGGRFLAGVEVGAVRSEGARWVVEWEAGEAVHDGVVIATPASNARAIAPLGERAERWLDGVRQEPGTSLGLVFDGPLPVEFFGLSFPRHEPLGKRVAAICVQANKNARLNGDGRAAVVVLPTPSESRRAFDADPAETLERWIPAVEAVHPDAARRLIRARVFRHPVGVTGIGPGALSHLRAYDAGALPSRLALAGDYLGAPTVEGAVRTGIAAAERILRELD